MKNRYSTGTLILIVLLTCGIFIKADSQIPQAWPTFKVAVNVQCDNQVHQSQVEGAIKRELRSFGDVQIVGNDLRNGLWEYMISVHLFGFKDAYGRINVYATSTEFYKKVPIEHFDSFWEAHYREYPAIYIPDGATGTYGINRLESMGKITAANFDKKYLQHIRDWRIRDSR